MSDSQSNEIKRPENLVRLKIDGAKTSVNTLRDQETARGVSLVCPFPALEVDIPVQFGNTANLNIGSIHRIGVEDDPETGLPRLRLSIRTEEPKCTVVTKTSASLLKAAKHESMDFRAETGDLSMPKIPSASPVVVKPAGSWAEFISEISAPAAAQDEESDSRFSMSEPDDKTVPDPTWAMSGELPAGELPLPEEIRDRVITRRRFRMVRHVAGAFVLGMLVASLYLFDRAGVISFAGMKDKIAAAVFNKNRPGDVAAEAAALKPSEPQAEVLPDQVAEVASDAAAPLAAANALSPAFANAAIANASYGEGPNPLLAAVPAPPNPDEASKAAPAEAATLAAVSPSETKSEPQAIPAETNAVASDEAKGDSKGDITLNLPTRWPAEYATAYRVREPNGVVVDVPGGLVKREGWMEEGRENPMIRSVKAIQRESGARFIVYVNGELPRFITTPSKSGVQLRLYFAGDETGASEVAALSK